MIPYVEVPPIDIGGLFLLQPFGMLVVIGCSVGYAVGRWQARTVGLLRGIFTRLAFWAGLAAFFFSHWFSIAFDYQQQLTGNPLRDSLPLGSVSSTGGVVGAAMTAVFFLFATKTKRKWEYLDAIAAAAATAGIFVRLGCTIVHDHPGRRTDFFLAVAYPDGPRHDLGFYEWLLMILINFVLVICKTRLSLPGMTLGIVCTCYGFARFLLDFLRFKDLTFFGLSLAQYNSILVSFFGIFVLSSIRRRHRDTTATS